MEKSYEEIIGKFRRKQEYYTSVDFPNIAGDYETAANAIEELLNELNTKTESKKKKN